MSISFNQGWTFYENYPPIVVEEADSSDTSLLSVLSRESSEPATIDLSSLLGRLFE
jgi:hypothetical protein